MVMITFATTCMGRAEHLVQTLPANINANRYPNVEFLILDYNSPDGFEQWVREHCNEQLGHGLNFYMERTQRYFNMAHAKNIAASLAKGEIVVNVDADQFIDADLGLRVVEALPQRRKLACPPPLKRGAPADVCGLIACYTADFLVLGGYDEQMCYGWGVEDHDLVMRASMLGFDIKHIRPCEHFLSHERFDRNKNTRHRLLPKESSSRHRQIHQQAMLAGRYVANVGTKAGAAMVTCNFSTSRESGFFPSDIKREFTVFPADNHGTKRFP